MLTCRLSKTLPGDFLGSDGRVRHFRIVNASPGYEYGQRSTVDEHSRLADSADGADTADTPNTVGGPRYTITHAH
jgi:hypothetical protein